MIKKIINFIKPKKIDLLLYEMNQKTIVEFPEYTNSLQIRYKEVNGKKEKYYIIENDIEIHQSFLYKNTHVTKYLGLNHPVIGSCSTHQDYKGKSIYPYVINYIANKKINSNEKKVLIIVSPQNKPSIRGIEKAGFELLLHFKATRLLGFYFKKK